MAIALIILLIMTIGALSSSRSILLQEKMSGAFRENHYALEAAESALSDAEEYIENLVSTGGFNSSGNNGLYTAGDAPVKKDIYGHANWNDANKYIAATTATTANVPIGKYILELVNDDISESTDSGSVQTLNISQEYNTAASQIAGIRVTALGESRDGQTVKIIQAYIGKRL